MTPSKKQQDLAIEWFTRARNEALAAMHSLGQQMTAVEQGIADDLLVRLMKEFGDTKNIPLPCILWTASKVYGMALHLGLENMQKPEKKKVTIN